MWNTDPDLPRFISVMANVAGDGSGLWTRTVHLLVLHQVYFVDTTTPVLKLAILPFRKHEGLR